MAANLKTGKKDRKHWRRAMRYRSMPRSLPRVGVWNLDILEFLRVLPKRRIFDLVVTSPPYNLGKEYEDRLPIAAYREWQAAVIEEIVPRVKKTGSMCWQVGNYVENGQIEPLDTALHSVFKSAGLQLRNRIIWHFGHGLHCQRRFSGRYETIQWYTVTDDYIFDLDPVRVPSKYPGKRSYSGPKAGQISSNPKGKNPEDVWCFDEQIWRIPNVKGNHKEKTIHPCQFPVGLVERLVLALTKPRGLVFDPFCGVGSAGVAAVLHGRDFWGCDIIGDYLEVACERMNSAMRGTAKYRPHDQPIYDHTTSSLSVRPEE